MSIYEKNLVLKVSYSDLKLIEEGLCSIIDMETDIRFDARELLEFVREKEYKVLPKVLN